MDFVLLWVNGDDPEWIDSFYHHSDIIGDKKSIRFRDWDNLKYWFRGIEKFAPWVNKIHFITCGHYPDWLNLNHPKLNFIRHSDYIPGEYLPTFNSNVIELFIHRIEGLSEQFVLFNDDLFLINEVKPDRFFRDGLPCDMGVCNVIQIGTGVDHTLLNNVQFINKFFNKKEVFKTNFFKWFNLKYGKQVVKTVCLLPWSYFTGFLDPHLPQSFLKSSFVDVWNKNLFVADNFPKFRNKNDYSQYLVHYWQLVTGNFYPLDIFRDSLMFEIKNSNLDNICKIIQSQKKNIIVLNDTEEINFDYAKEQINQSFEIILPEKSKFEL